MLRDCEFIGSREFFVDVIGWEFMNSVRYQVIANLYQNRQGCFIATYKYLKDLTLMGKGGPVVLNGSGNSKLKKKVRKDIAYMVKQENKKRF